jgi:hypothetical protein
MILLFLISHKISSNFLKIKSNFSKFTIKTDKNLEKRIEKHFGKADTEKMGRMKESP